MLFSTALAVLAFILSLFNLFQGEYSSAGITFILTLILGGLAFHLGQIEKEADAFLSFIYQNRAELDRGGVVKYRGAPITGYTEMTRFYCCVSVLLFSTKFSSRYVQKGGFQCTFLGLTCSAASLLLGWWGIPWGPIYTVQSLFANACGGEAETVRHILHKIS